MGEFDILIIAGVVAFGLFLLCVGTAALQISPSFTVRPKSARLGIWRMTLWWEQRRVNQNETEDGMIEIQRQAELSRRLPRGTSKWIIRLCISVLKSTLTIRMEIRE